MTSVPLDLARFAESGTCNFDLTLSTATTLLLNINAQYLNEINRIISVDQKFLLEQNKKEL
jgi:hypothetical protein